MHLQGVQTLSPPVEEPANQITQQANAQTPYDQARAIERWLRTNIQYNESIPNPPAGQDPIDWFLFEQQEGYCTYYASAMVMMLRAQGIPARMAAGFAAGTWDPEQNAYLVRERDAHTWVEAYFPGYGWIEFEPTADEAPIEREGDAVPQALLPTVTPVPSPTPPPTATPTAIPPTEESGAAATPTAQGAVPVVPATATPTPTPTATPPPTPEITRVDSDEGTDVVRTILLTLGIMLLVVLALVTVIVFAIWYVEYRGLYGLNPIQKAYARLGIYGRWLGLRFPESSTPDERRRYLVGELPDGEQQINVITRTYIRDRYADAPKKGDQAEKAAADAWKQARTAFLRRKLNRFFHR